jgi:glutamate carboxypeptidase
VSPHPTVATLRDAVAARHDRYLAELAQLVNIDCGSYTRDGVNRVADACETWLRELGASVDRHGHERYGDVVVGRLPGSGPRLLLIGHMDTVFGEGTAAARPFRMDGERALGPGVTDMKAGLLAGFHALGALQASGASPAVTYLCNPDEEIGSPFSTALIREQVPEHDLAFVLECARGNGDIVSARKGTRDLEIRIRGRAAHAGVEPEKGRSAILEAAHEVLALHALNDRWPSVTVNAGVIEGGTRPNVVAAECLIKVDVRAATRPEIEAAEQAVRSIAARTTLAGTSAEITLVSGHQPMEKTAEAARLVALAQSIAGELGFGLHDAATGGASDANTTAGMGLPTLDGLGPIGGDDHSADEWLDLASIVPRVSLLAALIDRSAEAL